MNELRLLFARSGDALTCRIAASWDGYAGEPQPFGPFLTDSDYENLRWYLEDYMDLPTGGAKVRAEGIEHSLAEWGRRLFALVFRSGDQLELYKMLLEGEPPRLVTVGTNDLSVLRLPWELMADGCGPLTSREVTIRRQVETAPRSDVYETGKLPLRILLAVSRPDDTGFLDPRHTTRAMLDALAPLGDGVVVDFCRPTTLDQLKRMLTAADRNAQPYHIVHFDGHGTFLPKSQIGALYFEKDEDALGNVSTDLVRADLLGQILSAHKIPIGILEACRSGQVGAVDALRGIAPALIEAGVGSVLSMSHAVHVEATKILLERFYTEVAKGVSIGQALEAGRAALIATSERWLTRGPGALTVALQDWFVPSLYQRGEDLVLVPGGAKAAGGSATKLGARRAPALGDEPGAFPAEPMYGFFGRTQELHRIERRFLKHRAVLLHAMGGMGKTSLAREAAVWLTIPAGLFPDGACFVSFEQGGGVERAVRVIGAYFEGAEFETRPAEEQRNRARELFQTKRVLVVWDNFESVLPAFQEDEAMAPYPEEARAAIYELFNGWTEDETGLGRLLVTCRPGETGLRGVCKVELGELARADALSMLYRVMQKAGVTKLHERETLLALLDALGMHPLSIELVGPHLKNMGPEEITEKFCALLDEFKGEAEVGRNRSLRASVEFSLQRLSKEARETVMWLGLFRGGVFQLTLLDVSQVKHEVWKTVLDELTSTALLRALAPATVGGPVYLRFHPTLPYATRSVVFTREIKNRYVDVYAGLATVVIKDLSDHRSMAAMIVVDLEEQNIKRAMVWAAEEKRHDCVSVMVTVLVRYLERAGRLLERYRWAAWSAEVERAHDATSTTTYTGATAEAWALLDRGRSKEAIEKLEELADRLKATAELDVERQLALVEAYLGRIYTRVGLFAKAVAVLESTLRRWENLTCGAEATSHDIETDRVSLAANLGDLSEAYYRAGSLDKAMEVAERGRTMHQALNADREIAVDEHRIAAILRGQGRYAEANDRCNEAFRGAVRAGDRHLQRIIIGVQCTVALDQGQCDRAAQLGKQALQIAQDMHDDVGIMQACVVLGVAEQKAGRLAEARAWYGRSREMAMRRADRSTMASCALNLGVVFQLEGEAARAQGEEARAKECLLQAVQVSNEALKTYQELKDSLGQAKSQRNLAQAHLLLGNVDQAEKHAHTSREINEHLGLRAVRNDYATLATIARTRKNPTDVAAWERERDAIALSQTTVQSLMQLAWAFVQKSLARTPLGADEEQSLATLSKLPAPLGTLAPFLRALAAGDIPPLPPSLPHELVAPLTQVLDAVREARAT